MPLIIKLTKNKLKQQKLLTKSFYKVPQKYLIPFSCRHLSKFSKLNTPQNIVLILH